MKKTVLENMKKAVLILVFREDMLGGHEKHSIFESHSVS